MSSNRIVLLVSVLALVAGMAVAGWVAGGRIISPAEAAARTAPPTPSPILVPIEERVLSSEIITRGTARFGLPQPIALAPSALKANAPGLLTTLPLPNAQLQEGDVMLTASGRPLLVLQGKIPAFRDLMPGTKGNDVRQLKEGLARLGFDPGNADDNYDERTSAAVAEWYQSKGYEPFGPTADQLTNFRTIELAYGDAKKAQMAAGSAAAVAKLGVESARLKANLADQTADADVAAKISERALIVLDPRQLATARTAADAKLQLARAGVRSAELDGKMVIQAALDAQKVAEFDANLTAERADRLASDFELAKGKLGVQVPVDEIVFIPELPVRVEQVSALVGGSASGPVMTVTDNQIVIDSSLPLDAAPLIKPGMKVAIDEQAVGIKTTGVVETVDTNPGTHGLDGYHIYFAVRVDETPKPLQGFSLRLTIPVESSEIAVTTVPTSALSLAADGTSRVQVEQDGDLKYVVVEPGLAADGFVQVTAVDGTLKPGQLVVVGNKNNELIDAQP